MWPRCFSRLSKRSDRMTGKAICPDRAYGFEEFLMFQSREEAALELATKLKGRALRDPLVLAIPRGGVIIGAALAEELGADLDVVLARKLRAPAQPELAIGSISETGEVYLDPDIG